MVRFQAITLLKSAFPLTQVVKAYDHKEHHHVAVKMVRNEKRFHRQAQEEIRILEHLRKQDKDNTHNIIHLFDHFTFREGCGGVVIISAGWRFNYLPNKTEWLQSISARGGVIFIGEKEIEEEEE